MSCRMAASGSLTHAGGSSKKRPVYGERYDSSIPARSFGHASLPDGRHKDALGGSLTRVAWQLSRRPGQSNFLSTLERVQGRRLAEPCHFRVDDHVHQILEARVRSAAEPSSRLRPLTILLRFLRPALKHQPHRPDAVAGVAPVPPRARSPRARDVPPRWQANLLTGEPAGQLGTHHRRTRESGPPLR
jgi:hypothetical protein